MAFLGYPQFPTPLGMPACRLGAGRAVTSSSATSTAAVPTLGCSLLLPHTKGRTQVGQEEQGAGGTEFRALPALLNPLQSRHAGVQSRAHPAVTSSELQGGWRAVGEPVWSWVSL